MEKEIMEFGEGVIEFYNRESFVYFKILNLFNDEMAMEMTRFIDKHIMGRPEFSVMVWDLSEIPSKKYKITTQCTKRIVRWSDGIKINKFDTKSYFIAPEPLIFGTARMYEIQATDENRELIVLKSIEELPEHIRCKIPQ